MTFTSNQSLKTRIELLLNTKPEYVMHFSKQDFNRDYGDEMFEIISQVRKELYGDEGAKENE